MADLQELNLSTRTLNCLQGYRYELESLHCDPKYKNFYSIYTIEHLISVGLRDLSKRPHLGKKGLEEIAYKVKVFASKHQIKFNENDFFDLSKKEIQKVPKDFTFQPNKTVNNTGYIYAISAENLYTKIGRSINFPTKRLSNISTSCPFKVTLRGYLKCEDINNLEKKLHDIFKTYHSKGEWYKIDYENIKILSNLEWIDH